MQLVTALTAQVGGNPVLDDADSSEVRRTASSQKASFRRTETAILLVAWLSGRDERPNRT